MAVKRHPMTAWAECACTEFRGTVRQVNAHRQRKAHAVCAKELTILGPSVPPNEATPITRKPRASAMNGNGSAEEYDDDEGDEDDDGPYPPAMAPVNADPPAYPGGPSVDEWLAAALRTRMEAPDPWGGFPAPGSAGAPRPQLPGPNLPSRTPAAQMFRVTVDIPLPIWAHWSAARADRYDGSIGDFICEATLNWIEDQGAEAAIIYRRAMGGLVPHEQGQPPTQYLPPMPQVAPPPAPAAPPPPPPAPIYAGPARQEVPAT